MSLTTPSYRHPSNSANLPLAPYEPRPAAAPALVSVPEEPARLGDYLKADREA